MIIKPKTLKYGDKIGIIAPSGPFNKTRFLQAIKNLQKLGFNPIYRDDIFLRTKYLAGSDKRRADELNQFFRDESIKAIICARGGYGASRIIPLLDINMIKKNLKIFIGFSDISILLNYFAQKLSFVTFHGPMAVSSFSTKHFKSYKDDFLDFFTKNQDRTLNFDKRTIVLNDGIAKGELAGGNLSIILSSIKTEYEIKLKNKILLIEDIDEAPYRVDRMMTHLKHIGMLRGIRGLICGNFIHTKEKIKRRDYIDIFKEVANELRVPIIFDFPSGHGRLNKILPIGHQVTLDTQQRILYFNSPFI